MCYQTFNGFHVLTKTLWQTLNKQLNIKTEFLKSEKRKNTSKKEKLCKKKSLNLAYLSLFKKIETNIADVKRLQMQRKN